MKARKKQTVWAVMYRKRLYKIKMTKRKAEILQDQHKIFNPMDAPYEIHKATLTIEGLEEK